MIESKTSGTPRAVGVPGRWVSGEGVEQVLADEALFQAVNGQCYLTLGQYDLPVNDPKAPPPETLDIRPVARIVMGPRAFHSVLDMLNRIADSIPKPEQPSREK